MGHWGKIIGRSIAISFVIWGIGLYMILIDFYLIDDITESMFSLYLTCFPPLLLGVVTLIVASIYGMWYSFSSKQKPRKGIGTLSEMTQRGVELLEAGTLPRALPQALLDEFSLTSAKAHEISRTAIKRWQAQG